MADPKGTQAAAKVFIEIEGKVPTSTIDSGSDPKRYAATAYETGIRLAQQNNDTNAVEEGKAALIKLGKENPRLADEIADLINNI